MVTGLDHAFGGLCTPSDTPCPLPAGGAVGFRLGRYPPVVAHAALPSLLNISLRSRSPPTAEPESPCPQRGAGACSLPIRNPGLQADALKLLAKKLQSSLAVEGELPEEGLAAYGDDGDDLMMVLARKIVSGEEEDEAESVSAGPCLPYTRPFCFFRSDQPPQGSVGG